jgi:hypothetical protein
MAGFRFSQPAASAETPMKDPATNAKLEALRMSLVDAQRRLILEAAELAFLPPDRALQKIAVLESVIAATEVMIDDKE